MTDNHDLAKDRTDWAEDRTVLANERTFAGWMRTGLGSLGMAIAMQAVFGAMQPTWIAKGAATVFVVIALAIFAAAWRNSCKMLARLDAHASEPVSSRHLSLVAAAMAIGTMGAGVVLWLI